MVVGFRERSTKSILIQFGSLAKLNISVSGSRPAVLASTGAPHELQHAYKRTSHLESLVHSWYMCYANWTKLFRVQRADVYIYLLTEQNRWFGIIPSFSKRREHYGAEQL